MITGADSVSDSTNFSTSQSSEPASPATDAPDVIDDAGGAVDEGGSFDFVLTDASRSWVQTVNIGDDQRYLSWRLARTYSEELTNAGLTDDLFGVLEIGYDETSLIEALMQQGTVADAAAGAQMLVETCHVLTVNEEPRRDLGWVCEPFDFFRGSPESIRVGTESFHYNQAIAVFTQGGSWPKELAELTYHIDLGTDEISNDELNDVSKHISFGCLPGGYPECSETGEYQG